MNNNKTKNPRAWRSLFLLSALTALLFGSCSNDTDAVTEEITLTTPVLELGGVEASASRAADALEDMAFRANLFLYMQNMQREELGGGVFNYSQSNWSVYEDEYVTLTGGIGSYYAGIVAIISLKSTTANMPTILNAIYGYRGTIEVLEDGSFIPGDALLPHSSAVQWVLNDANGVYINPSEVAESEMRNKDIYRIRVVRLASMHGYWLDDDNKVFPNGTSAPVPKAHNSSSFSYNNPYAHGDYTPGTYPATWPNGKLEPSAAPSAPWPLVEVVYCKDGFDYDYSVGDYVPKGESTTWTVSYPAKQLILEPGKLYTFTITLGKDAHITLGDDAIGITPWQQGTGIHVGK